MTFPLTPKSSSPNESKATPPTKTGAQPGNYQQAPYPDELADMVAALHYRPGWHFDLVYLKRDEDHGRGESRGLTLVVTTKGYDSYNVDRGETYRVRHYFPVPPATYDDRSWRRWLFEQVALVERHECCEFFRLGTTRPYAPSHGPGNDPYMVREVGTFTDVRTSFRGEVNE